jgi:tricorn protease-like protein
MLLLQGHTGPISDAALVYAPDGRMLVSGSDDGTIRVWDLATGKVRKVLEAHKAIVTGVAFGLGGSVLVSGSHDRMARVWSVDDFRCLHKWSSKLHAGVVSVAVSADGRVVAVASGAYPRAEVQRWDLLENKKLPPIGTHGSQIGPLAFSPDGRLLATGSMGSLVRLWNVETGEMRGELRHRSWVQAVAFSGDSQVLAPTSGPTITLWDVPALARRALLRGHAGTVRSLTLSPDGKALASASVDRSIRVWDLATGKLRAAYRWNIGRAYAVAFSPSGMTMAAGGDKDVVVWDLDE